MAVDSGSPVASTSRAAFAAPPANGGALAWFTLLARLVVGGSFVWLGKLKLDDPVAFLKAIREYQLVPAEHYVVLNVVAGLLPYAEILLGVLLVLGIARRGTSLVLLVMLVAFTFSIYQRAGSIAAAQSLALCDVKFDCGCGNGIIAACSKLAENSLLIVLSAILVIAPRSRLALRDALTSPRA